MRDVYLIRCNQGNDGFSRSNEGRWGEKRMIYLETNLMPIRIKLRKILFMSIKKNELLLQENV